MKTNIKHKHDYIETGKVIYTNPLQYEEKCNCGSYRWKMFKSINNKIIVYEYQNY